MAIQTDNPRTSGGQRLNGVLAQSAPDIPLVTVVTAVFNGEAYLRECLESVLAQDYPNIEHIILDGGSTDGTLDILREYNDRVALWKSEPDKGVYDAWNKALTEARGDWISFLGADDEFLDGAISAYMETAIQSPSAEYIASLGRIAFPSGYEKMYGRPLTWKKLSRRMQALHVGSMHKRSLFERHGKFNTAYRIVGDYEFLLRPHSDSAFAFMDRPTVLVRAGGISDSVEALHEASKAKVTTGEVPLLLAKFDLYLALIKYMSRPVAYCILRTFAGAKSSRVDLP